MGVGAPAAAEVTIELADDDLNVLAEQPVPWLTADRIVSLTVRTHACAAHHAGVLPALLLSTGRFPALQSLHIENLDCTGQPTQLQSGLAAGCALSVWVNECAAPLLRVQ